MPPPRALKRSSWKSYATGLFYDLAAEHVYTTFFIWQYLWGRDKHDPSRHLSPDRRTRMGRIKISTMLPITLKVRRNRTDKSSWKFYRRVGSFIDKNDVKFWLVSSFVIVSSFAKAAAKFVYEPSLEIQKYRLQCGRIYEIMKKVWELSPTAYKVRPHFWAYAFWSSEEPLFPGCGCVLIVDAYSLSYLWYHSNIFYPPPAADILSSLSSWSKN